VEGLIDCWQSNKKRQHAESSLFYWFCCPSGTKTKDIYFLYKFNYSFVNMDGKSNALLVCMYDSWN